MSRSAKINSEMQYATASDVENMSQNIGTAETAIGFDELS